MNDYCDLIIDDIRKNKYKKEFDKNDVILFLSYTKKYLFYPVFYKCYLKENADFLINKISFLLSKISRIPKVSFLDELKLIKLKLENTLDMIIKYDPSIFSRSEIVLIFPSFNAIFNYRIAHFFYENKEYLLARVISEIGHIKTGIDIHPGAKIGDHFFIDHGDGIVIGQTSIIKDYVKLYHGVTLGSNFSNNACKRHPTIENNVTIYANSTILGGNTIIGENSIIGSGVLIKKSIESNSIVKLTAENYVIKKRSDI